jgi:hypothetical protein
MKKIVLVLMAFVVVVSTTVYASDTLRYDAGKSSSDKCFLTKGKIGVITGIDSIFSFVVDKANNQEKVIMYRGGHIRFIEWVQSNYIKQADPLDNTKIMMTMTGGLGDPLYIIPVGGDTNSPEEPQVGFLYILLIVVVIAGGWYGLFRLLK